MRMKDRSRGKHRLPCAHQRPSTALRASERLHTRAHTRRASDAAHTRTHMRRACAAVRAGCVQLRAR
eukprot:6184270-Pleurochrysis_carterae.AAC.1